MKEFADRPFAVLGVNVNGYSPKELREAMTKENLTWRSFADPGGLVQGAIAKQWHVRSTPTIYLLDEKGVIRRKWAGSPGDAAIDAAIRSLVERAEGK